jgi:hypothetical protein
MTIEHHCQWTTNDRDRQQSKVDRAVFEKNQLRIDIDVSFVQRISRQVTKRSHNVNLNLQLLVQDFDRQHSEVISMPNDLDR